MNGMERMMRSILFSFTLSLPCEVTINVPEASEDHPVDYAAMVLRLKKREQLLAMSVGEHSFDVDSVSTEEDLDG